MERVASFDTNSFRESRRHLSATSSWSPPPPHSGNDQAFRTLLGLLDGEFENLPTEIELDTRENLRKKLALHLVQRRRADIRHFLDTDTAFPKRLDSEETYAFARRSRQECGGGLRHGHAAAQRPRNAHR